MVNHTIAPICLFVYNRLEETKLTVEALKKNFMASESELFIFSDGPKYEENKEEVVKVRDFIRKIDGFKRIRIKESMVNKGLADSIIDGVTELFNSFDKVIVLEDDLITSPNFLNFMNQSLEFFKNNSRIFSTTGWSLDLKNLHDYPEDFYCHYRASSWGWGIWKNRWEEIVWDSAHYKSFKSDFVSQFQFRRGGADLPRMLKHYLAGKNDSWAIRACYHQYKCNLLTVAPAKSKVKNIGFGVNATHTKNKNRFDGKLDGSNQRIFTFKNDIILEKTLIKEFREKFSLITRLKARFGR